MGAPALRLECLNPSILKTERPPVTCARSNSYCGRRNRLTAPPAPPARAGSFIGTFRTCRDFRVESAFGGKAAVGFRARQGQLLLRVSDAGRSQRCGLHRGRRPKAFNEGTRGKWQAVAPRAPSAMEVCAARSCVRATDADGCVG